MPLQAVLFDLDLTLIASAAAAPLRRQRAWSQVYKLIPALGPYDGVTALIAWLRDNEVRTAIVTSSPRSYCTRIVRHHKWQIDVQVCYHDTVRKKPFPDPNLKALELLGVRAEDAVVVGDDAKDIQSAKAARIFAVAALWGAEDPDQLLIAQPDLVCRTVVEFQEFLARLKEPR